MNSSEESLRHDYQKKELSYFKGARQEMLRYIPHNAYTILEVGCGCGNFSELLKKKRSVEVWGIELSERAAVIAADKLDKVLCGC